MSLSSIRLGTTGRVFAAGLLLAATGCVRYEHLPRTTVDVGLAGGVARSGHYDSGFLLLIASERFSHAGYALSGGTVGVGYFGKRPWGGVARLSSSGGFLTYAEEIYRQYGTTFDRYHVTSVSLGAALDVPKRKLVFGLSVLAGASTGDRPRARGAFALPYARLLRRFPPGVLFGLLLGSEDGYVLDATLGALGLGYAREDFRLALRGGLGARILPELDGDPTTRANFPRPRLSGDFPLDPLVVLDAHVDVSPRAELGARFQLLGVRPQGMLLVTFRHERARSVSVE